MRVTLVALLLMALLCVMCVPRASASAADAGSDADGPTLVEWDEDNEDAWELWSRLRMHAPYNCTGGPCKEPQVTKIGKISLCQAPMAPSWVLAVLIGVIGGLSIVRLGPGVVGSRSYSVSFFTYAVMMTSGFVVHCVFKIECGVPIPDNQILVFVVAMYADSILTSCIAISFLWNGLVDVKILSENSAKTWLLMFGSYGLVAYAFISNANNFPIIYMGSIIVGCGAYLVLQLIRICMSASLAGVKYLIIAGVAGGGSFLFIAVPSLFCKLCQTAGWLPQGVWYYGADVSMLFLALYVLQSRVGPWYSRVRVENFSYAPVELS